MIFKRLLLNSLGILRKFLTDLSKLDYIHFLNYSNHINILMISCSYRVLLLLLKHKYTDILFIISISVVINALHCNNNISKRLDRFKKQLQYYTNEKNNSIQEAR